MARSQPTNGQQRSMGARNSWIPSLDETLASLGLRRREAMAPARGAKSGGKHPKAGNGKAAKSAADPTVSPPLEALAMPLRETTGVPTAILDFRKNSATYADGVVPAQRANMEAAIKAGKVIDGANPTTREDLTGNFLRQGAPGVQVFPSDPAEGKACVVTLGQPSLGGRLLGKAASVAGGRGEGAPTRAPGLTDESIDNLVAFHEIGHCADPSIWNKWDPGRPASEAYKAYLAESRGDAFAAMMETRRSGSTAAATTWADLRAVATVRQSNDEPSSISEQSRAPLDAPSTRYFTAPIIDAAVRRSQEIGIGRLRAMSPKEVAAESQGVVGRAAEGPEAFFEKARAFADTRSKDGALALSPDLPPADAARSRLAIARLGIDERGLAKDLTDASYSQPSYEVAAERARDAAKLGVPPEAARRLRTDFWEGARVEAALATSSGVSIAMRERDGTCSNEFVAPSGAVRRKDAMGTPANLSELRPASAGPGGASSYAPSPSLGGSYLDSADQASNTRRPSNPATDGGRCVAQPAKTWGPGEGAPAPNAGNGPLDAWGAMPNPSAPSAGTAPQAVARTASIGR